MYHPIAGHEEINELSCLQLRVLHGAPLLVVGVSPLPPPVWVVIKLCEQCRMGLESNLNTLFIVLRQLHHERRHPQEVTPRHEARIMLDGEVRSPDDALTLLPVAHHLPWRRMIGLQIIIGIGIAHHPDVAPLVGGNALGLLQVQVGGIVQPPGHVVEVQVIAQLPRARPEPIGHVAQQFVVERLAVVFRAEQVFVWLRIEHDVRVQPMADVIGRLPVMVVNIGNAPLVEETPEALGIAVRILAQRARRQHDGGQEAAVLGHQLVEVLIAPERDVNGHEHNVQRPMLLPQQLYLPLVAALHGTVFPAVQPQIVQGFLYYVHDVSAVLSIPHRHSSSVVGVLTPCWRASRCTRASP